MSVPPLHRINTRPLSVDWEEKGRSVGKIPRSCARASGKMKRVGTTVVMAKLIGMVSYFTLLTFARPRLHRIEPPLLHPCGMQACIVIPRKRAWHLCKTTPSREISSKLISLPAEYTTEAGGVPETPPKCTYGFVTAASPLKNHPRLMLARSRTKTWLVMGAIDAVHGVLATRREHVTVSFQR